VPTVSADVIEAKHTAAIALRAIVLVIPNALSFIPIPFEVKLN